LAIHRPHRGASTAPAGLLPGLPHASPRPAHGHPTVPPRRRPRRPRRAGAHGLGGVLELQHAGRGWAARARPIALPGSARHAGWTRWGKGKEVPARAAARSL
jgi:hypothetical protein